MQKVYPALFFLFFSIYVCFMSVRLGLGALHKPGPGFMPFWSAVLIGILAILLLAQHILRGIAQPSEGKQDRTNFKAVAITLACFFAYILSLQYIGFIIGTVLFAGVILKGIEKKGWFLTSWVSLVMALASYYVFKVWLQAELPKGFLGF